MSKIPFVCPKCGCKTFKVTSEPKSYEDFVGAVCTKCGATMTKDHIGKQATEIVENKLRDAFKKSGIKFK